MKLIGLFLLAATCIYIGQKTSSGLRLRIDELDKWLKIIRRVKERVRFETPIPVIFKEIGETEGYRLETVEKIKDSFELELESEVFELLLFEPDDDESSVAPLKKITEILYWLGIAAYPSGTDTSMQYSPSGSLVLSEYSVLSEESGGASPLPKSFTV